MGDGPARRGGSAGALSQTAAGAPTESFWLSDAVASDPG
jgi:hypothetical protein